MNLELDDTATGTITASAAGETLLTGENPLHRGESVGRYVLLDRLGAGAMGVVYAAFDPDLDRKVALKLLRPRASGGSDVRLLREAQALAKLAHPNVVTIHDVGTHGDRVWLAMEFVAGQTLDAWAAARPRRWPELLRALKDVARGVAAAHAAGLVHRDLKPENVMVDQNDRVRVMDFGLAHGRLATLGDNPTTLVDATPQRPDLAVLGARLTQVGAMTGTPAYMAPEQWDGREAEAAADQFGWCVMAWELLHGERPFAAPTVLKLAAEVLAGRRRPPPRGRGVPRWLTAVLVRGLSTAPEQRYPDMAALLAALDRGRARSRLRLLAAVLVAVATAAAAVAAVRHVVHLRRVAACASAGRTIDGVWNDEARAHLRATFAAHAPEQAAATLTVLLPWFDRQADAWSSQRAQVCHHADIDRDWDADTIDRALWCLDHRRLSLAAEIDELAEADPIAAQRSTIDASRLATYDHCTDRVWLHEQPAPPTEDRAAIMAVRAEVSRSESLMIAGKFDQAVAVAAAARVRAQALAWTPLVANAQFAEGLALHATGAAAAAEAALADAYYTAARDSSWALASDAANQLIFVVGYEQARTAEARGWFRHAEVAAAHISDPTGLVEATRLRELAAALDLAGDYTGAIDNYRRCLAVQERHLAPDDPDIALTLNNLGSQLLAIGDAEQARSVLERAIAIYTRAHGPDHPEVALALGNLGSALTALGDDTTAKQVLTRALTIREHTLGPDHPAIAFTLTGLAEAYDHGGELPEARALLTRALALRERSLGPTHPLVAESLASLARVLHTLGDDATARAHLERALTIHETAFGPDHPGLAATLSELAALDLADDPRSALPRLERAVTIYTREPGAQPGELTAQFRLARALAATDTDRPRARELAERARDGLRANHQTRELAEVEAWLAAPAPPHSPPGEAWLAAPAPPHSPPGEAWLAAPAPPHSKQ